jgi:hypothetical protein
MEQMESSWRFLAEIVCSEYLIQRLSADVKLSVQVLGSFAAALV